MISVKNLVQDSRLLGNFFSPDAYLQGDVETGLLESRGGSRLIALPEALLQGLYNGLTTEVGQAAGVVLFQCGNHWGKHFYRRFGEEISKYYQKPLAQMEMVEFLQCLKQCWKTHGWGVIDFNFDQYQQGFIVAKIKNSPFDEVTPEDDITMGYAEAGILSSFFTLLTGRNLHCVQTAHEKADSPWNCFVIGVEERIKPAEAWRSEGQDHDTIMERLGHNQPAENN
jgi:uncharacterized protein